MKLPAGSQPAPIYQLSYEILLLSSPLLSWLQVQIRIDALEPSVTTPGVETIRAIVTGY